MNKTSTMSLQTEKSYENESDILHELVNMAQHYNVKNDTYLCIANDKSRMLYEVLDWRGTIFWNSSCSGDCSMWQMPALQQLACDPLPPTGHIHPDMYTNSTCKICTNTTCIQRTVWHQHTYSDGFQRIPC